MNKSQMQAIKRFINNAEKFFSYINSNNQIEYTNGPVQWSIEHTDSGVIWLRADNITDEFRWFHTAIHLNVLIGARGKVKIYTCEGIEKKMSISLGVSSYVQRTINSKTLCNSL